MNNKGVTMIELLIVIVVLGIISTFSTVAVGRILDNVRKNTFAQNGVIFVDAAKDAYDQNDPLWDDDIATLRELMEFDYISSVPKDPWGGTYNVDETKITVEVVLGNSRSNGTMMFLATGSSSNTAIFRARIVSSSATIGFVESLEVFTKDDIVLLTTTTQTFYEKITKAFTNDINDNVLTDNGDDDIDVDDDIKGDANVNTSGGNDTINVGDDIKEDASVNTGDGDDILNIDGEVRDNATVSTGSGNDTVTIDDDIQNDSRVDTGDGDDTVYVGDDLQSGAVLNTGSGNDTITVDDELDNGTIEAGDGNDTVILDTIRSTSTLNTGDGNDVVTIDNCSSSFRGTVSLGAGNDSLTIIDDYSSENLSGTSGTFDGGSGADTLYLPNISTSLWNRTTSDLFSGFETIVLSDGTLYN